VNIVRRVASLAPTPVVKRLGRLQFEHPATAGLMRALAARAASGEGVIARGPGAGLRIDATGRHAGYVLGTSDQPEHRWLAATLREGDIFCDAGAAIGYFSLLAARIVGPSGSVTAFEPSPESAARLRKNVALNDFGNVEVVEAAVSSTPGRTLLAAEDGRWDAARLQAFDPGTARDDTVEVEVVTIDAHFAGRRAPDVMKLDVEGAEIAALEGALGVIDRARPTILVEVHWLGEPFAELVRERFEPLGYEACTLTGGELPRSPARFHALLTPPPGTGRDRRLD
jgi:FkbM family methyltransferase